MWADSFQRDLRDVFALQSEVASAIAQQVRAKLTPEERNGAAAVRPVDPAAYEAYLKGRYYWYRRTPADAVRSRDFFQEAVDRDPSYAAGWAGLAAAYHLLSSTPYGTIPPREGYPKVLEACRRAIALDPSNAEAYAMRGLVRFFFDRDAEAAETDFLQSGKLEPRYAQGRQLYSFMLLSLGRMDEAVREAKAGRDLEPLSLVQNANVAYVLHFSRRYDEAIEWSRKTLAMDADFLRARWILGMAYEQKRMFPEAIVELERARELSREGPVYVSSLGHAYAAAGKNTEARRCLDELRRLSERRFVGSDQIGVLLAGLGQREAAIDLFEKGIDERTNWTMNIGIDPRLDSIRSEARFVALLKKLGLSS